MFFAVAFLVLFQLPATAASLNYTLYIEAGTLTVSGTGGASMAAWSYTDMPGTPKWPGPVLSASEGDTVEITVVNSHNINHNFVIQGITTDTTAIPPGAAGPTVSLLPRRAHSSTTTRSTTTSTARWACTG